MTFAPFFLAVTIVAHDPGYYTSLSKHIQRWLGDGEIASSLVTPAQMRQSLAREKVAFLVGFESPSDGEMKTLREFSARGGKLVVFHSASRPLADLMGVKPLGYKSAAYPGQWSRMVFQAKSPAGLPAAVAQNSGGLNRAAAIPGRSQVIATWYDRGGKPTGDAAWIASPTGYWMTHVLLSDGDEALKARLVAAICGGVDSALWSPARANARAASEQSALKAYAERQRPRAGEIHAVWDHTGCGLYPGDWARTMRLLVASGVTDLFVNVAGAGFAHYPSAVLPQSKTFRDEGDQLAACLAAAKGTGIRVHAWVLCFSATRGSPETLAQYARRGWRLKAADGRLTEYVDPANASVRALVLAAVDEILGRYRVSGIHLDFVRWGDAAVKPRDAAAVVTRFVAEARRHVARPRWLTAAVYGKHPQCVGTVGQDWKSWLDAQCVDYVVPMDYTEDPKLFGELLALQSDTRGHAARTIVGLGVTANESRLDARKVIDQANLSRARGFAGQALFDLDATLESQILPYLKLGLWSRQ